MNVQQTRIAVSLLRRGILTISEVARFVGVSRQALYDLCRRRGIDLDRAREGFVTRQWRKAVRNTGGVVVDERIGEKDRWLR